MLKKCILALAALVTLTLASAAAQAQELVVGTFAEVPPFEFVNDQGRYAGLDINVIESIARESGLTARFVNQPFDTLLDSLAAGKFHAVASAVTITPERQTKFDFSEPYFTVKLVAVVKTGAHQISGMQDIKDKKVAVLTGTTCAAIVDRTMGEHNPNVRRFSRYEEVFKDIVAGTSDVAIVDEPIARTQGSMIPGFKLGDNAIHTEQYGFAVRKGDATTLGVINAGLKKIKESGEFELIHRIWFPEGEKTPVIR